MFWPRAVAASDVARAAAEAKVAAAGELLAELRRAPSIEVDRHPLAVLDKVHAELDEARRQLRAKELMLDMLQQPQRSRPWWRRLIG